MIGYGINVELETKDGKNVLWAMMEGIDPVVQLVETKARFTSCSPWHEALAHTSKLSADLYTGGHFIPKIAKGFHPPPPRSKYSAEWKGYGHVVVLKVVTGDAVLLGLNVYHLTKFLRFFRLPHRQPLCCIRTAHYIGGTAGGHCEAQFTRGCIPPTGYCSSVIFLPIFPGRWRRHPAPAKYSDKWEVHGNVVQEAVPGDIVLQIFDVCPLNKLSFRFFCLPRRISCASVTVIGLGNG